MTWNYRIIDHGDHLALHEVHYDAAGGRSRTPPALPPSFPIRVMVPRSPPR